MNAARLRPLASKAPFFVYMVDDRHCSWAAPRREAQSHPGQDKQAAIVSATSLAAESLNLGDRIGVLSPGMEADVVGVEGDPLKDITVLRRVAFVMKGGKVYKGFPGTAAKPAP